jgi:hypothetical protein
MSNYSTKHRKMAKMRGTQGPDPNSKWAGWWALEPADAPSPGKDFWSTAGNVVQGIWVEIKPVAMPALIAALASLG